MQKIGRLGQGRRRGISGKSEDSSWKRLSPALRTFVEFFEIGKVLIQVAAEASGRQRP